MKMISRHITEPSPIALGEKIGRPMNLKIKKSGRFGGVRAGD